MSEQRTDLQPAIGGCGAGAAHEEPRSADEAPDRTSAWHTPLRGLDLLLVLVLTAGLLILARAFIGAPAPTVEIVLALLALQSVVPMAAIYLVIVRGRGISWSQIGFRPAPMRWYLWAAVIALASLPAVALINLAIQTLLGEPFRNPQLELLAPAGFSWTALIGVLILAGVIAPIVEETVFRGLLYGWLRARLGLVAGVALSAAVFALAHGILILVPVLLAYGVLLALIYEWSRSLWPPIVLHGIFNIVMTLVLFSALAAGVSPDELSALGRGA